MASINPGDLVTKVNNEINEHENLAKTTTGTEKDRHESIVRELKGILVNYNTGVKKIQATKDFDKIKTGLSKLAEELESEIIIVANKYGLKDFIYDVLDVKTPLNSIKSQIIDQLEKNTGLHPGKPKGPNVVGDGHANSATAAEAVLGWKHQQTNTNHMLKTSTARGYIQNDLDKLDALNSKAGGQLGLENEEWYIKGQDAVKDCDFALKNGTAYLNSKGQYKIFLRDIKRQRALGINVGYPYIVKKHNL